MPDFPKGLTLNTIVSILATGSKSALLCMVRTSIGNSNGYGFKVERSVRYMTYSRLMMQVARPLGLSDGITPLLA